MIKLIGKNIIFPIGNIPVKISGIVTANKSPIHQTCLECNEGSVGKKSYCKNQSCGIENTKDQIGYGFDSKDGLKVFSKDQMDEIKNMTKNIVVRKLVSIDQVDYRLKNDSGYYLTPSKDDESKLYAKIYNALKKTNQALATTWKYNTNSTRDKLGVILPLDNCLVLYQMNYHEELNELGETIDLQATKEETIEGIALLNTIKKGSVSDIVDQYQIDLEDLLSSKPDSTTKKSVKEPSLKLSAEQIAEATKEFASSQTEKPIKKLGGKKSN